MKRSLLHAIIGDAPNKKVIADRPRAEIQRVRESAMSSSGEETDRCFSFSRSRGPGSAGGTRLDITVPAGTIIDGSNPQWRGTPLSLPVPISSQPLDAAALTAMQGWYTAGEQQRYFTMKGF